MPVTPRELLERHGSPIDEPEWTIVCVGCFRLNRASRWTDERASDTGGHSTGFCDKCARARRMELKEILAFAG
jgi:hypothetical protein